MSSTLVRVTNATDTYVAQDRASTTYYGSDMIETANISGKGRYAYIYFARPFPLGVTVLSAKLRLTQRFAETGTRTATLKRISSTWTNRSITWNNRPGVSESGPVAVTKGTAPQYTVWEFNVQPHMQLIANGTAWYGWRVQIDEADYNQWYSANASVSGRQVKPTLEVTYIEKPSKPTWMSPAAGRITSLAKPVLRFDFTDRQGSTTMRAFQVQMNSTNSFTSPSFDTGEYLADEPQLDLSTTAFAGLADGELIYWRVRVQDDSSLWSDWSDVSTFWRQDKVTVNILNPPGAEVDEPTPPILWEVTGGTQSSWQVLVRNGYGAWIHSSGKRTNSDTSYTIPAGVITQDGVQYIFEVRIWDTYAREATPGDTSYAEAERTTTYTYDPTTDPVTDLVAEVQLPTPVVKLTWERATAPDSFVVRRDGVIIKAVLLPLDALVSGTTYSFTDYESSPGKAQTYSVHAVVNGKTSSPNPEETITPESVGIWLMDPSEDLFVQLLDVDEGSWSMGEDAGMYAPLGASKQVRVTQALRGHEGSLSGLLAETPENPKTIDEQVEDMYALKSRPGKTYTLALSDMSIPVVIGNVVVAPMPQKERMKRVSFEFWSQKVPFEVEL
ncbi:DNRLRE domain-containing protein [Streptomyces sp. NPDC012950]|uniref:DNRLRE domain-containing protein n=1 Tax=Streptomyces sp. NPDC012950 TaxID=3364858 RepID=UPI0036BF448E